MRISARPGRGCVLLGRAGTAAAPGAGPGPHRGEAGPAAPHLPAPTTDPSTLTDRHRRVGHP
ncbi:hypothetical protein ABZ858_17145 [Streptomyces sp. NPDC047017]|uniref:hypothetical protein n=1 Tax=Streptomyces sp. NPDC047017 TaxID=3155024 RepID=UPI00340FDA24